MRWISTLSRNSSFAEALDEVCASIKEEMGGAKTPVNLVFVFASTHHAGSFDSLSRQMSLRFPDAVVVGCSASGVIAGEEELEDEACLAVTVAHLPGVTVHPMVFSAGKPPYARAQHFEGIDASKPAHLVLFVDPLACEASQLLAEVDGALPLGTKVGGLASGGRNVGEIALFLQRSRVHAGAVGVVLQGDLRVDTLVAQGCRPIGEPYIATRTGGNVIFELGGRKARDVLRDVHDALSQEDQELFKDSLFLGIEVDAKKVLHKAEQMLVRNVIGFEPKVGSLAVGTEVERHQVVQFLLRDARAAHEELEAAFTRRTKSGTPDAALMFTCVGRGAGLFGAAGHDSGLLRKHMGAVPIGGFFCNGEIGPVGKKTYLHGYTTVLALVSKA